MVVDFAEYAEKKRLEREKIAAEQALVESRETLAKAYAEKGLKEIFESRGYAWTEHDIEMFTPLMEDALVMGLTGAEIETMIVEILEQDFDDLDEDD